MKGLPVETCVRNSFPRSGRVCSAHLTIFALLSAWPALGADFASIVADRSAIERVYYNHRLGEKPPFEQTLPPAAMEAIVRRDLRKEAALKQIYGLEITPALLDPEVQRINTTTRAPDMLAEIKTDLGNDAVRFANAFARPILVERLLREKFDNDDALHVSQRRQAEQTRADLLAARSKGANCESLLAVLQKGHSNQVTGATWRFGEPPPQTNAPATDEIEVKKRFGPNATIMASPRSADGRAAELYFQDLPDDLQKVLRAQLRAAGDVSAVIEAPTVFLLYLAMEKTAEKLKVSALSLPKQNYEQWLDAQSLKIP